MELIKNRDMIQTHNRNELVPGGDRQMSEPTFHQGMTKNDSCATQYCSQSMPDTHIYLIFVLPK